MLLRWFLKGVKGQNGQIAWLALLFALAGLELRIWIGIGAWFPWIFFLDDTEMRVLPQTD
jgi:fatty acid desaturase